MRPLLPTLLALAFAVPAVAQPALVIPPGEAVVIPPRGGQVVSRPRPVLPPAPTPRPIAGAPTTGIPAQSAPEVPTGSTLGGGTEGGGLGLAAPLVLLPLVALGALAASGLPGSGGGTTAPARTR